MKSHTSEFKEEIKLLGKQQDVRITYTINDEQIVLSSEDINSATPNYEASLLKSVMKGLDLDSNVDIPLGTQIKFEYGLLVNGAYEYLDYGNYIVYSSEKQEDTLSYSIKCYDKLLYSMKDYEHIEVDYPCKINKFLTELCKKIGLEFKDSTFANQDREFANELFMTINEDGTYSSMGYTYRDVLDQIAETTGGCICITLDDKVEVRYINKTINYETSKKSTNIEFESSVKEIVKIKELDGKSTQDGTPSPEFPSEIKSVGDDVNLIDIEDITFTAYHTVNLKLEAGTYTFSADIESNDTDSSICRVYFYKEATLMGYINLSRNTRTSATIELADSITRMVLYASYDYSHSTGDIATFTKTKLQKGTVATSYSEYGKGTVTIEQSGKNILNTNIYIKQSWDMYIENPIKKVGQYTISCQNNYPVENKGLAIAFASNVGTIDSGYLIGYVLGSTQKSRTANVTQAMVDAKYLVIRPEESEVTDEKIATMKLQLEEGDTATAYEPYFSKDYVIPTTPLRSLPNGTKDTIEEDGIHRNMLIADMGDLDWMYSNGRLYTRSLEDKAKGNSNGTIVSNIMCNVYNAVTPAEWYSKTKTGIAVGGNGYGDSGSILIYDSNYTSASAFKEAMKGNYIQYELSEEVVEPFTDEQLEVINSMVTEKGTNIFELESNAILNYPVNYDTINEEYINDTNVNFVKKY